MRFVPLSIAFASSLASAAPTPPKDPCARNAFDELAAVQARARALATTGTATLADKLELAMSVPTGYVMQSPGSERFRELFATSDAKTLTSILTDLANDLDTILADGGAWRYRCEAYPQSHVAAKPPTKRELAERRAIAKRTTAAHARADECAALQGKVLALPGDKRHAFTKALDRCYLDLQAAHEQCERDFATLEHTDGFAPYQTSIAVSNLIELRRAHTITADDVIAVRGRAEPMLDSLRPPLSSFTAPVRKALASRDPVGALYETSGALKTLYSPCERLWTSSSRCIVNPESCRPKPNR